MNEVASQRNSQVLDQSDFYHIMGVTVLGSLFLMPALLTDCLTSALANRIQKTTEPIAAFLNMQVILVKRRVAQRAILITLAFLSTAMLPLWAFLASA